MDIISLRYSRRQPKKHRSPRRGIAEILALLTNDFAIWIDLRKRVEYPGNSVHIWSMSKPASEISMRELLEAYPWARRALFQKFHIGGCASCGFGEDELLAEVCARNGGLSPEEVLAAVQDAHAADEAFMMDPDEVRAAKETAAITLIDIRSADEFQAVNIPGSLHFTQDLMQEIMNTWPRERAFVVVDHTGDRSLDAVSYFAGHGFSNVRCLRGGIDAYSRDADSTLPRYTLEQAA